MQTKKNIRLLVTLAFMIVITVITYFLVQPEDSLGVDRGLFSYENTLDINRVVFEGQHEIELAFSRNQWMVNQKYDADPQRINVLFAILQQVRVRRPSAVVKKDELNQAFNGNGTKVKLYADNELVKEFEVVGEESTSLTYMRFSNEDSYLVEIPGYKSYLAGIFGLDENGWRNPLVFQLNWANLSSVSLSYPNRPQDELLISFEDRSLKLEGEAMTDSTKLGNFIDDISLFYVNDYITEEEADSLKINELQAVIEVRDIAKNRYKVEVLGAASGSEYYVRIDSTDLALMQKQMINRVTKPRAYFRPVN